MNENDVRQSILELLKNKKNPALTPVEIAERLRLRGGVRKRLQRCLNEMARSGQIVCIRKQRYSLGEPADLLTGTIEMARSGNGFVSGTGQAGDVFVPEGDLSTALPGDKVVVRLNSEPVHDKVRPYGRDERRRSGKVIEILERTQRDVVGTVKTTGKFLYVVPIDSSYKQDFYVADARDAKIGDRVVIRFTNWENRHVSPEAEIVEVLGPADNPSIDTISIIRHYGLRDEFPAPVVRDAEVVSNLMNQPGPRLDLRDRFIITIDPARARDFDDALSLEKDAAGNRVLGVHIADVSHFVRTGGALDKEAAVRGNSVYLPDKVMPMLPEQLSNGVCSLKPNEDRLAFSVFMTMDDSGRVTGRKFSKSIIRSRQRLTYEEAFSALDPSGKRKRSASVGHETALLLRQLNELGQEIRRRRFAQYALDLDVPECEIVMGPDHMMTGIRVVENDLSHQLVEECMVAANEAVATELSNHAIPQILRIHEPPKEQKIEDLTVQLQSLGLAPGDLSSRRNMAEFLIRVASHPLAHHIRVAVLRSMNRALYSVDAKGHFGLAKKFYSHFTSPIRRYADLIVHRQLAALLTHREKPVYSREQLVPVAQACTETDWTAEEAERELMEIKKYRYLAKELEGRHPKVYAAVVVSVVNFGMFVEIVDLQLQGLVHVSTISDKFVRFDRQRSALNAGKEVFKIGRKVDVVVSSVDFDKRRIDFALAK